MKKNKILCRLNPVTLRRDSPLIDFAGKEAAAHAAAWHKSLPGYASTPLIRLKSQARHLGIDELLVKDESRRFDLNAFKVLGASYAVAKILGEKLGIPDEVLTYDRLRDESSRFHDWTFTTATDGNHGRAVAWTAAKLGCRSVIFMPAGSSRARADSIRKLPGTEARITDGNYDDTVILARDAAERNGWILVQDTSWPGYEKIPRCIMQGYLTMISEFLEQAENIRPTHVFVQAGVGSLAAAVTAGLTGLSDHNPPRFITVEPHTASCLYESIRRPNGLPYRIRGDLNTIMAGLACGEPSRIAWNIIRSGVAAFISCSDDIARSGMRMFAHPLPGDPALISGESGAVTLGIVHSLLSEPDRAALRKKLALEKNSRILLLSTEGDTDPDAYRRIVGA